MGFCRALGHELGAADVHATFWQARGNLHQAAAIKLDPIATEALAILEKKLMEDVSKDAAEVGFGRWMFGGLTAA